MVARWIYACRDSLVDESPHVLQDSRIISSLMRLEFGYIPAEGHKYPVLYCQEGWGT